MKNLVLALTFLLMASSLMAEEVLNGSSDIGFSDQAVQNPDTGFPDQSLQNSCCPDECSGWDLLRGWEAEVRGAGVYASSSRFRKIYSDWSPEVQIEVAKSVWCNLYAWFNVAYLWNQGRSKPLHNKTHVSMVPLTFGLKYLIPLTCDFSAYIGGGSAYSFVRTRDHSPYVKHHISRQDWGGVVKSGIRYNLSECIFLDGFVDYLFQHFNREHNHGSSSGRFVETRSANLSGWRLGLGIGLRF